jgi:hypothetical protein
LFSPHYAVIKMNLNIYRLQRNLPLLILLLVLACSKDFSDNPKPNQPPDTFISFFTENELNATISRQTISWWGDDPDGIVVGYIYTFKESPENVEIWSIDSPHPDWTFTTKTTETFNLKLSGADTVYTLLVKAIDDNHATDPTPAVQRFPIINSNPQIEFPVGTDVPETTFTVASFTWTASDLDGDDTIAKFQYILDDTTDDDNWIELDAATQSITLTFADGLSGGEHIFYLRALDIAGASSKIIRMPRTEDDMWFVKEP